MTAARTPTAALVRRCVAFMTHTSADARCPACAVRGIFPGDALRAGRLQNVDGRRASPGEAAARRASSELSDAGGLAQRLGAVGPLPREVGQVAAEVAV